jgi:copper(I)-binding protein
MSNRSRSSSRPVAAVAALALAAGIALGGCASGVGSAGASGSIASAAAVSVTGAWVRPASVGGETAGYLTIANVGDVGDALVSASSPVAGSAMLHVTATDASGMTGMSMVDRLPVEAHRTVTLAPGAAHLMLSGLTSPLALGSKVELHLTFERAGLVVVMATVRAG